MVKTMEKSYQKNGFLDLFSKFLLLISLNKTEWFLPNIFYSAVILFSGHLGVYCIENMLANAKLIYVTHNLMGLVSNLKKIPQNSGDRIRISEGMQFNNLLSIKFRNVHG